MDYPGLIIGATESDPALIEAVRRQLAAHGYPFGGDNLTALVRTFQSHHGDAAGRPLRADGRIGPLTWGALFDVPHIAAAGGLGTAALDVAVSQIGVSEVPPGSNSGPAVDRYLKAAGAAPGFAWCMAFVCWCFGEAAARIGIASPFPRTAGCLDAWNRVRAETPHRTVTRAQAIAEPARVRPGMVFVHDHGHGLGHAGIVRRNVGGALATIEGNSNRGGSRTGTGVFALDRRSVTDLLLKGFLDFTDVAA